MNKNFLRAINDIKKQKRKQGQNKIVEAQQKKGNEEQQVSSSQQAKLKALGAFKKKIVKQDKQQQKWKHDRFQKLVQSKPQPKPIFHREKLQIKFTNSPGYNNIFPLVKSIKIYIREIDDSHIIFNNPQAYQSALQIYKKAGIAYSVE